MNRPFLKTRTLSGRVARLEHAAAAARLYESLVEGGLHIAADLFARHISRGRLPPFDDLMAAIPPDVRVELRPLLLVEATR